MCTSPQTPPMRIIQYFPGVQSKMGGVVRSVLDWCGVLAARGHQVTLVTFQSPDVPSDWNGQPGKPSVVHIPPGLTLNSPVSSKAVRMWENLLSQDGGIVHLHTPWTSSNLQMARVARRLGIPYIVTIHGMLDNWSMKQHTLKKQLFLALWGRRHLQRADRLHYTAVAEQQQAEPRIPGSKSVVLPALLDFKPFQSLPGPGPAHAAFRGLEGDDPKLLFLSRLHKKKGVHLLLDAAALLRDRGRKFKLLIAGSGSAGYETRLHHQAQRLKLDGIVTFIGQVAGVEKISLYQSCDLFILPTYQENFGLVLVEALASGTPVITTRGTDIWQEIAAAGGKITDNTPAAIADCIDQLLGDRASLAGIGQRGRQWVLENLSTEKVAAQYENMYAQVIAAQRRRV